MRAQAHKLVNHREAAQNHPVAHMHMAGELRVVGENSVVAHHTVMRQVHVGHDPVVIAHARHTGIAGRADVERAKLTNGIAVANDQLAGLTRVLFVLRDCADGVELKDLIVAPDGGVAFENAVRAYGRAGTDAHVRPDDGVRTNADRAVQLCAGIHQRCGMDDSHLSLLNQGSVRMVHMSSASQAMCSPTRAVPLNLKIPDFMRSSVTSMIS